MGYFEPHRQWKNVMHCTLDHIRVPALAIDIDSDTVRALLYVPSTPEREPHAFGLPLPTLSPDGAPRAPDYDPRFWAALCEKRGLPEPEITLVSAAEPGGPLPEDAKDARNAALHSLFAGAETRGFSLDSLIPKAPAPELLRLSAVGRMTGFPTVDVSGAFILGLTALPEIAGRSHRQGVTLLLLDRREILAALLFQEHVHGFLRLPSGPDDSFWLSRLPGILEDFRLGWLPPETIADGGGFVWRSS